MTSFEKKAVSPWIVMVLFIALDSEHPSFFGEAIPLHT